MYKYHQLTSTSLFCKALNTVLIFQGVYNHSSLKTLQNYFHHNPYKKQKNDQSLKYQWGTEVNSSKKKILYQNQMHIAANADQNKSVNMIY